MPDPSPDPLDLAQPRSLSAQVARALGEQVLDGALPPGRSLPDENALAARFGVSRTVIREAVKTLAAKGMLDVRQRIGTQVRPPRDWQMLDRDVLLWHRALVVEDARLLRLTELRRSVEPDAAGYAAARRTDADLVAIFDALERMRSQVACNARYVLADA